MIDYIIIKFQEACFQYWPNTGAVKMGEYTVQLLGEEKKEGYILRTINIQYKKVQTNRVDRYS